MTTTSVPGIEPGLINRQVASEIKAMMARAGMTQTQLARELGVSMAWVSDRLRGRTIINLDELDLIAEILDVSIIDLFPRYITRSSDERLALLSQDRPDRGRRRRLRGEVTGRYLGGRPPARGAADPRPAGHPPIKRSVRLTERIAA